MASESNYSGSFQIPTPKGVYQAAGDTNINANYAYRAENMRTERGLLASACGTSRAFPSVGYRIDTFTRFYRRNRPDDPDVYVCSANGSIYTYTMGSEGWSERKSGCKLSKWSCVTYEINEKIDGEDVTIDILLMSNEQDGMYAVRGDDLSVSKVEMNLGNYGEEVHFSVLGRYAERVWGTGDPKNPDAIFYSRPYDPLDWSAAENETAELGGGMIQIPTWDGDSFVELQPFCGYLLAIKRRSVFEIRGTDPTTFSVHEAYGTDGPVQGATACVDRTALYFLSHVGLGVYNGSGIQLLSRDALHELMLNRAEGNQGEATACVCNHVYYLAMRVKEDSDDGGKYNNTVIEFDSERGTFMIRKGIRVRDFYALDGVVYYTDSSSPYEVLRYNDPNSPSYLGIPMDCVWETPWLDLGKSLVKRDFVLRFTAEADEKDFPIDLTLETERRAKKKTVVLQKGRHDYRVKIQNAGKRVKLRIESGGRQSGWRIYGGVQVDYTFDEE